MRAFEVAEVPKLSHFVFCEAEPSRARGEMMNCRKTRTDRRQAAFTLLELLAVVAIITILLSLLAPAVSSFSSSAGRKGAVNILMNTLEQARAAALETGCDIYVLLWRREFPDRDAVMVVREPSNWLTDTLGNPEQKLVPLTGWVELPEGVLLHKPDKGSNVFSVPTWPEKLSLRRKEIPVPADESLTEDNVGVVSFTGNGSIIQPLAKEARIVVTEGVRGVGGTEARLSDRKSDQSSAGGGFDIIRFSRFTGRTWLEVTTLE